MQPDAAGSKVVLSEEDYVAQLRAIIQRDYFPDIPKLTTRLELINALQSHLDSNLPASNPAAPTTPPSDTTLDEFLNTHTSEDNSSFEEILVRMQANHREKFAWSFPKKDSALKALPAVPSGDSSKVLLLTAAPSSDAPSSPSGALVPAPTPAAEPQRVRIGKTEYWPSDPRSSFMFTPHEPIPPPQQEVMGPPKSISRHNTRFRVPPKATAVPRSEEEVHFQQMASDEDLVMQARAGRLGGRACDLDELLKTPGGLSPQVGGCGFVSTPSPAPGLRWPLCGVFFHLLLPCVFQAHELPMEAPHSTHGVQSRGPHLNCPKLLWISHLVLNFEFLQRHLVRKQPFNWQIALASVPRRPSGDRASWPRARPPLRWPLCTVYVGPP